MKITVEHREGKYPSMNVSLHSGDGKDAFMTIKGCRIIEGSKGQFVSFPARKDDAGKYWPHVWASEAFQKAILAAANMPDTRTLAERRPKPPQADLVDVPF